MQHPLMRPDNKRGDYRVGGMKSYTALFWNVLILAMMFLGNGAQAQPPARIDPNAAEAIIEAFLANATEHQMDAREVDIMLEEISRQDQAQRGEPLPVTQEGGASFVTCVSH